MNLLGMDIGGTFIKYGTVSASGQLIESGSTQTPTTLHQLRDSVLEIAGEKIKTHAVKALGIGLAGFIAADKTVIQSPNLLFLAGVNFQEEIEKRIGIPVIVENDANAAAFGEFALLPDPKPGSFIHLTLGTGLGSGIILDGKLWHGEHGCAAELGHVVINPEGRPCGCGGNGCIETEASATALVNNYSEATGKRDLAARDIFDLYKKGDSNAVESFKRLGVYLGIFLASVINFLNPKVISIGGGVAAAGDAISKPAMDELKKRISNHILEGTYIRMSETQNETGIIGAASLGHSLLK
ncbi:MAG: ROK family protein [bacterium]|nr:ROK family protein [bacterium]